MCGAVASDGSYRESFMTRSIKFAAPIAVAAAAAFALPAQAAWPEKPITMLVGFKAGGGADTLGRIVSKTIAAKHGWKFVIKNKSGAGGGVMAKALLKEKKDGYTIGMAVGDPFAFDTVVKKNLGYTADDFVYLGSIAKFQMGIMAMKDKGWNTLDDAMKAAKAKGSITMGSMSLRLTMASKLIARHYGVNIKTVPARGGRGVMNQLLGGHVDIGWGAGIQARYVSAGKMVILASAIDEPLKQAPAKKTLVQLGMPLLDISGFFIMVGAKGMPAESVQKISSAIEEAVKSPDVKNLINQRLKLVAEFYGPDVLAARLKAGQNAARKMAEALK